MCLRVVVVVSKLLVKLRCICVGLVMLRDVCFEVEVDLQIQYITYAIIYRASHLKSRGSETDSVEELVRDQIS